MGGQSRDLYVEAINGAQRDLQLLDQGDSQQLMRGDHRRIVGQRRRRMDGSHTPGHDLGGSHVVRTEERFERGLTCPLRLLERGPAQHEVTEDNRVMLLKPI